MVANGPGSPLIGFPFTMIGSVVLIIWISIAAVRGIDMRARSLLWHEYVIMALLGAVAAMTYDLVLVAPALALTYIAAQAAAAGMPISDV